ncbi:MAG: hypothetical protein K2I48_00185 [Muribaculaceae bacterium]|nr:hypothetical protein [Muribaculaceae bacterium]
MSTKFTPEQYAKAAVKFRGPLLKTPYLALKDQLQFLTPRFGITGTEIVGQSNATVQLHPYRANERQQISHDIVLRELTTYFGTCNAEFEPNAIISSIIGHRAAQAKGDGLKNTLGAQDVLFHVAHSIGEGLGYATWNGVRNPQGKTTADLFDGYDTITAAEIEAGNISEEKKNYMKVPAITNVNAVEVMKKILYALHPVLRRTECFVYCAPEVADAYNEAYQMTHTGLVYNDKYDQVVVEGSGKKLIFVPLAEKAGSKFIQVCPKSNMLVGMDQLSDKESVNVAKYDSDTLVFEMRAFFGVQFESIDARRMFVAEIGE